MVDTGIIAARKENVVIQAGDCSIQILPAFGGKIASIKVKGQELLQAPLAPIESRSRFMGFDQSDASGWDECLPSVAACRVETANGTAEVPDHGDLWQVEWAGSSQTSERAEQPDNAGVSLQGKCFSLPLQLERTAALTETEFGWRLVLHYRLENSGEAAVPWSWAAHPLFAVAEGDRIVLPQTIRSLRLEGSGGGRLGTCGDTVAWPLAKLADGGETDLSTAQDPESEIGDKLFAGPLSAGENWCALERPSAGLRLKIRFDVEKTPYLGLWICYGGWPDRPGPKQVCVALEPATAPVDSLAIRGNWSRSLEPGASYCWPMQVDIENI